MILRKTKRYPVLRIGLFLVVVSVVCAIVLSISLILARQSDPRYCDHAIAYCTGNAPALIVFTVSVTSVLLAFCPVLFIAGLMLAALSTPYYYIRRRRERLTVLESDDRINKKKLN